jgi:phage gp29-like protein
MAELYDAYGRPVDTGLLKETQAAPTWGGVRNIYSSMHPEAGLTPEGLTAILRTAELGDPWLYLEMAEAMEEKDLHYLAVLSTRKHAVGELDFNVEAASSAPDDVRTADFVRETLLEGDLDLRGRIFDIEDALGKGWSVSEIIWDLEGPEWRPKELVWRDPKFFIWDWISGDELLVRTLGEAPAYRDGRPGALTAWIRPTPEGPVGLQPGSARLWPYKFVVHKSAAKSGLPVRGGLARIAAWVWLFKMYVLKDWVAFAEVYGQPLRVGKYGAGSSAADRQALLNAVANIGVDAAAIIPDSMLIEFVENKTQAASNQLYEQFCDWLDRQTTKGILGQTLTTELPKGGGSRAAAMVHDMVRRDIAMDDARRLSETLNRDLVKPLVDLNLGPRRRYPKIRIGFPDESDLARLSGALTPFIDRGLPVAQKAILDKFGLAAPAPGEPVLHPAEKLSGQDQGTAPAPPSGQQEALGNSGAGLFTDVHAAEAPERDAIERFVARLRDESAAALAPMVKPLLKRLRAARDYGEMKAALARAVAEMEPAKFVDLMTRAGFAAALAGETEQEIQPPAARARALRRARKLRG